MARASLQPAFPPATPGGAAGGAIADVLLLARRRRLFVVLGAVAVAAAVVVKHRLTPPQFDATALVRFEREQVNLPQLLEPLANENRISTEMEVLQARTAALAVIDSLGLRVSLESPRRGRLAELVPFVKLEPLAAPGLIRVIASDDGRLRVEDSAGTTIGEGRAGDTVAVRGGRMVVAPAAAGSEIRLLVRSEDEAVRAFTGALKVFRPVREADLLAVRFRAADPAVAAEAANMLAGHLIGSRQTELARRTGLAVDFLRHQADTLRRQLRLAEDSLQAFRETVHAVEPAEQAKSQVVRMAQLQANRGGLDAEREALATLLTQIEAEVAAAPERPSPYRRLIGFPSLLRNQAAAELLSSLASVENERAALLRRRTPMDPDVLNLTGRVRELDAELRAIAESYLQGLTNQVAALDRVNREFGRALDSLPNKEVVGARLEREAKILQDLYSLVQTRLKESELTQAMQDPTVRVVDPAVATWRPVGPGLPLKLALGVFLGALVGLGAGLAREMLDRSVRSRSDAFAAAGLPVLGSLPLIGRRFPERIRGLAKPSDRGSLGPVSALAAGGSGVAQATAPGEAAGRLLERLVGRPGVSADYVEALHQLQVNLALSYQGRVPKAILFTSALPGDGKTLTALNFALTAATQGAKVLLVDADTRCGKVHEVLGCPAGAGLGEVISGRLSPEAATWQIKLNAAASLAFLPAGTAPLRGVTLDRLRRTVAAISPAYDLVVIDGPPVNAVAETTLLAAAADGVLMVVRSGRTDRPAVMLAVEQLALARAPLMGTVLNGLDRTAELYGDGRYGYPLASRGIRG